MTYVSKRSWEIVNHLTFLSVQGSEGELRSHLVEVVDYPRRFEKTRIAHKTSKQVWLSPDHVNMSRDVFYRRSDDL